MCPNGYCSNYNYAYNSCCSYNEDDDMAIWLPCVLVFLCCFFVCFVVKAARRKRIEQERLAALIRQ